MAEAYQNLEVPELDGLADRVTECCAWAGPQRTGGSTCGPCIRKGITSGRESGGPYAVPSRRPSWCGWWSLGGNSGGCMQRGHTGQNVGVRARQVQQEASFLYDMYLDDEDLEAIMASKDVKGAFPNTPHRVIGEEWRQLGLP